MKATRGTIRVWDPVVRIGHWVLVVAFFTAYFTEDDFLTQHVWAGYVVGTVVCVRLLWGFVGTKHARFSDFLYSPATIAGYIRDLVTNQSSRYTGHNPAGGAMIVVLLASLAGTVFSGLVVYAMGEHAGPLAGWIADKPNNRTLPTIVSPAFAEDDDDAHAGEHEREGHEDSLLEEIFEEIHEVLANLTLLLVGLHVAGVVFSSYREKENLIWSMVTGRKRRDAE